MKWYRIYHGMPANPKFKVIALRLKKPVVYVVGVWLCLLDEAAQHDPRGVVTADPEIISVVLGIEVEEADLIIKAFREKGLIDQENRLPSWKKKQYENSTERARKSRAEPHQDF